jgi:hypothetical protein
LLPVTACPLEFNSLENEWPVMKKHQTWWKLSLHVMHVGLNKCEN